MSDFGLLDSSGLFSNDLLGNSNFLEETVQVSSSGQNNMDKSKDILGMTLEDCGLLKDEEVI